MGREPEKLDIYLRGDMLESENKRLEASKISKENKEHIRAYQQNMLARNVEEMRVVKISMMLRILAGKLRKSYAKATKKDIEKLVAGIHSKKEWSASTKSDYKQALKQFYKALKETGKHFPPEVDWISVAVKRKDKQREELIDHEEVLSAIYCCTELRDKAFLSLLYESGARIGEILNMKIRDFTLKEHCAKVRLYGKTGERRIAIVESVPHINKYIQSHPAKTDPEAQLWIALDNARKNEALRYIGAKKLLKRAFRNAGIKKKCNAHLFRHSRATELAGHLTEAHLCTYFGWSIGSRHVRTYVHMNGKAVDDVIMAMHGISQENKDKPQEVDCFRCGEHNVGGSFCKGCGFGLSVEKTIKAEANMKTEMDKTLKYMYELMKNPELVKKFEAFTDNKESNTS